MSARAWKPGDVAITPDGRRVVRGKFYWWGLRPGGGSGTCLNDEEVGGPLRPLVVIDPEDREQVERLCVDWFDGEEPGDQSITDMQAALRSLIEPPKPEEPTDPTAHVVDRRDNIWRLLADGDWVCTSGPDIGEYLSWSGLTERGPLSVTP